MAKLYFRYGAMNSGKSAQLMLVAHNYEEEGKSVCLVKPEIDSKGEDYLVSRIGLKRKVDIRLKKEENIKKSIENLKLSPDCILVDEAQFLTKKQVDELMELVIYQNIPVICYGLRTDFLTNSFDGSRRLLEIAHSIEEIKTICMCGKKALFVVRKVNGEYSFSGNQISIDGENNTTYESKCPKCYYEIFQKANIEK